MRSLRRSAQRYSIANLLSTCRQLLRRFTEWRSPLLLPRSGRFWRLWQRDHYCPWRCSRRCRWRPSLL